MMRPGFTDQEIERYSRQLLLPEVGGAGQQRLRESSVFVVGAGGLGSSALLYLAAADVGRIGLIDADCVELSNLQRQIIHQTPDVGRPKTESAQRAMRALNPAIEINAVPERLTAGNIRRIVGGHDVVLDGSDNFPTRFLVADFCWFERIRLVSAAVLRFEGQLLTVLPGEANPCYRCFAPGPPPPGWIPSCQEAGVLGPAVGVMGVLQAAEAIKLLVGLGETLHDRLLVYDALDCTFRTFRRTKDPNCPLCGRRPSITGLREHGVTCGVRGGEASCAAD